MAKMAPIDIWNVKGATFEAEVAELGLCLHLREHDEFENDDFIPDDLHENEEDGPHIDDGKQKKRSKNSNLAFRRPTSESCKRLKKETEKSQVYEYQYGSIAFCSSTKNTRVSKKKGVANYTSHSVVEVEK
ncbi:hypothetical protein Tco_1189524 [Tanacetum coccineum]